MLITFPFYTVKRGSGGADAPPHPPRGGQSPPPAPPPYVTNHAPAAILGAAGRGLKWRDPIILYFHFPIETRHVTAKGWRLQNYITKWGGRMAEFTPLDGAGTGSSAARRSPAAPWAGARGE